MKKYIGLTLEKATELAEKENLRWRVTKENGERFLLTQDIASNRVNFEVEDNIVTKAEIY
jgi:hypothetical protein